MAVVASTAIADTNPDLAGSLWIAHDRGVARVHLATGAVQLDLRSSQPVRALTVDLERKTLWTFSPPTLNAFDFDGNAFVSLAVSGVGGPYDLALDPQDGSVWLSAGSSLTLVSRTGGVLATASTGSSIRRVEIGSYRILWVAVSDGVLALDAVSGSLLGRVGDLGNRPSVMDLTVRGSKLWIGLASALREYSFSPGGTTSFSRQFSISSIQLIDQRSPDHIWVSTTKELKVVTLYPFNTQILSRGDPFPGKESVSSLVATADGGRWVGSTLGRVDYTLPAFQALGVTAVYDLDLIDSEKNPPTISILSPAANSWVMPKPAVRVAYSDAESGVDTDSLQVVASGSIDLDCSADVGSATCMPPLPLADGATSFAASVSDFAGNSVNAVRSVLVDGTTPSMSWIEPGPDALVSSLRPDLLLRISDAGSGIDPASLRLRANGVETAVNCSWAGDSATCRPLDDLGPGVNELVCEISDVAGNTAVSEARTVTISLAGDVFPPRVEWLLPAPESKTYAERPDLRLALHDDHSGVAPETLQIAIDGQPLGVDCEHLATYSRCRPGSDLQVGAHTLSAVVLDRAGNSSAAATRTFTVLSSEIAIAGVVLDQSGAPVPGAEVWVIGQERHAVVSGADGAFVVTARIPDLRDGVFVAGRSGRGGSAEVGGTKALTPLADGSFAAVTIQLSPLCEPGFLPKYPALEPSPIDYWVRSATRVTFGSETRMVIEGSLGYWDGVSLGALASAESDGWSPMPGGSAIGTPLTKWLSREGEQLTNVVRVWEGGQWTALPGAPIGTLNASAEFDVGGERLLVVGGRFSSAGGNPTANIAAWDGEGWRPLGPGLDAEVKALAVFEGAEDRRLIVGGNFGRAGSVTVDNLAKWDGTSWEPIAKSVVGSIEAMASGVGPEGYGLYVAGNFIEIDGVPAENIARWDGEQWYAVGGGLSTSSTSITIYDDGVGPQVVVGSIWSTLGLLRWDGSRWSGLGGGADNVIRGFSLDLDPSDSFPFDLLVGGEFERVSGWPSKGLAAFGRRCERLDRTPPSISVDPPGDDYATRDSTISIHGSLSEAAPLTLQGAALSVDAELRFAADALPLSDGENVFVLEATDAARNSGRRVVRVVRDMAPPTLEIVRPESQELLPWQDLLVEVEHEDDFALDLSSLRFELDGAALASSCESSASTSRCRSVAPLLAGPHQLLARIADQAGNEANTTIEFEIAPDATRAMTVLAGGVELPGGEPAVGAEILLLGRPGVLAVTDAAGRFTTEDVELDGEGVLSVVARYREAAGEMVGVRSGIAPNGGAVTDIGLLRVVPRCAPILDQEFWRAPGVSGIYLTETSSGADTYLEPRVLAMTVWDDGNGPALYAGGRFEIAGGLPASNIARWDGKSWTALRAPNGVEGVNGRVLALAVHEGELYVGGEFSSAGGTPASKIAKWNGSTWSAVGGGVSGGGLGGSVRALRVYGGALYAGGNFSWAGGGTVAAQNVARWDGVAWSALGGGVGDSTEVVYALEVYGRGSGELYVGGTFDRADGIDVWRIARWNGSSWRGVGGGVGPAAPASYGYLNGVYSLASFDGELYVGGFFSSVGPDSSPGFAGLAKWNGKSWSQPAPGFDVNGADVYDSMSIQAMQVFDDGSGPALYLAGDIELTGPTRSPEHLLRWDGVSWSKVSGGMPYGHSFSGMALAVFDDDPADAIPPRLFMGNGSAFAGSDKVPVARIASWDGRRWRGLGTGVVSAPSGFFTADVDVEGVQHGTYFGGGYRATRYDGASYETLPWVDGSLYTFAAADLEEGRQLVGGGHFDLAGARSGWQIARFDGASWRALGAGIGTGTESDDSQVFAVTTFDDGSGPALYAAGDFRESSGQPIHSIARWSGSDWRPLAAGIGLDGWGYVTDLATGPIAGFGEVLVAAGKFEDAGGEPARNIATWDGTRWHALGTGLEGYVSAILFFDDGSGPRLYAAGKLQVAGIFASTHVARWDGSGWSMLAGLPSEVFDLEVFDDGSGPALYATLDVPVSSTSRKTRLMKWSGATWSQVGSDIAGAYRGPGRLGGGGQLGIFDDGISPALLISGGFSRPGHRDETNSLLRYWRPLECPTTDTRRPTIRFESPAAGSTVASARPAIRLSYEDSESGVDPNSLTILRGSTALVVDCSGGVFDSYCTPVEAFEEGPIALSATVRDAAGNLSIAAQVGFTVDSQAPTVDFYDPLPASILGADLPPLRFRFDETGSGVDPGRVTIEVAASTSVALGCTFDGGGGECTSDTPVADTRLRLEVSLADLAGNQAESVAEYFVDTSAPTVAIVTPADSSIRFSPVSEFTVSYVEMGSGVDPASVVATLDGATQTPTCTLGEWSGTCALSPAIGDGTHEITFSVSDRAGRRSAAAVSRFAVATDGASPSIAFVLPAPGATFDPQTTPFELAWSDDVAGVDAASLVVTANGEVVATECVSRSDGASCRIPRRLVGGVSLVATVRDLAGKVSPPATVEFTVPALVPDRTAPVITLSEPTGETYSNRSPLVLRGRLSEPAALTVDGTSLTVYSDRSFRAERPLAEGMNTIVLEAMDPSGNIGRLTLEVLLDTTPPAGLDGGLLAVGGSIAGQAAFAGEPGCVLSTEPDLRVIGRNRTTGAVGVALVAADRGFTGLAPGLPGDEIELRVVDLAGNESGAEVRRLVGDEPVPIEPGGTGTEVSSPFCRRYSFLWSGSAPAQLGVAEGAIDCTRVAVVHGRVLDSAGGPLAGARVVAPRQLGAGVSLSRSDGTFDLAVNGGGEVVVEVTLAGRLPVQRAIAVDWNEIRPLDDLRLTELDSRVSSIDLAASQSMQVARGSASTDSAGDRQATVLFPTGTTAAARRSDGSLEPLTTLSVRATEYTVGDSIEQRLPGPLPPAADPSYVVALTVDEAAAFGADSVEFSTPLPILVENFLSIPDGSKVQAAYWSRHESKWVALEDGRVLRVLAQSGGLALLDVDGSGIPADDAALADLAISTAELRQIAALYSPGESLLRIRVTHFTDFYIGLPLLVRQAAFHGPAPDLPLPRALDERRTEDAALGNFGGLVDTENQILRQALPITGTPLSLVYASDRTRGRKAAFQLVVPLSGATVPTTLQAIELTVETAGKSFRQTFPPAADQAYRLEWDGLDAFGLAVPGPTRWSAEVAYVYPGALGEAGAGTRSFDLPFGQRVDLVPARGVVRFVRRTTGTFTPFDAADRFGLGGWSIDVHHAVDPLSGTVFYGNGDMRRLSEGPQVPKVLVRVAGVGRPGNEGDDGPARDASVAAPRGLSFAPDGSLLVADEGNCRIRRIARDGTITTVAGTDCASRDPESGDLGDGGLATASRLLWPAKAIEAADGSIYIADTGHRRIRRIDRAGVIHTVAGTGQAGCRGGALEGPTDLTFDPSGNLLVLTDDETSFDGDVDGACDGVWLLRPDGELVRLMTKDGGGIPMFGAQGFAVRDDGAWIVSQTQCLREFPPGWSTDATESYLLGGRCHLYGGGSGWGAARVQEASIVESSQFFAGDGELAGWDPTRFYGPTDVALGRDGTVYVADTLNGRIRSIGPDRRVATFAGGGGSLPTSDGVPAQEADLGYPSGVAVSPSGTALYFSDELLHVVWKVTNPAPFGEDEIVVPSADGAVIDVFDGDGNHLRTEDGRSRRTVRTFRYTEYPPAAGSESPRKLVTEIEDAFGNVVRIDRDGAGEPLAIVAPFGQTTTLVANPSTGYLESVSREGASGSESVQLDHGVDGLLSSLRDPNQGLYGYEWSDEGRLRRIDDPAGGSVELTESWEGGTLTVVSSSALGRSSSTALTFGRADGDLEAAITGVDGLVSTSTSALTGAFAWSAPSGEAGSGKSTRHAVFGVMARELEQASTSLPGGASLGVTSSTAALATDPSDPLRTLYRSDRVEINGRTASAVYDGVAGVVTVTSPMGRATSSRLDNYGRVVQVEIPGIEPTQRVFDDRGRLARIEQGAGEAVRRVVYGYDATSGELASVTDSLGRSVTFERDPAGRVTKQILPDLREIAFGYDANGNLTSVTPPTRPAHGFEYTPVDQVEAYTPPDAGFVPRATTYGYNADRQLTSVTRPDGQSILYEYEPQTGRLDKVTLPAGEIDVAYDAQGRVASIGAPSGATTSWTYDGPLVTGIELGGPVPGAIAIERNAQLEVSAVELAGTPWTRVAFGYDADGLLSTAGGLTLTRRADNGLLESTSLGLVTDSRTVTSFGELDVYAAMVGGSPAFAYDLDRDAVGRITKKTETFQGVTAVWEYAYHPERGWLTEVRKDGVVVATYAYDANGNRTSWNDFWGSGSATHDSQDRLLAAGDATYAYTANGELESKSAGSETTSYVYDVQGALTRVTLPTGVEIEYLTDADGRRIGKRVNGTLVQGWLYAGGLAPIAETDGAGTITTRYVYGTRVNVPGYLVRGGQTYRLLTDHLGSVRLVVDAAGGAVVQRLDYDAFGRITLDTNPGWQPFGFAGGMYDPQTGLTRFGARDYDPEIGRWTSKDPIGFAGGSAGLYEYCSSDPVNFVDPTGLWGWDETQIALDAAGLVPGFGEVADLVNAGISLVRGNYGDAALSVAAMVPVLGSVATGAKGLRYADEAFEIGNESVRRLVDSPLRVGGETVYTTSGREAHKLYRPGPTYDLRVRLRSGLRPDAVDFDARVVRELKPNNPRAIRRGTRQVERYRRELQEIYGGEWTGVVDVYNR